MPIQNPIALYELDPTTLALTGSTAWFAGLSVPPGWLIADGSALSRTVYSDLFAAIGTAHGAGDGSTTFQIPDIRGEFIRGFDNNRGIDAGRVFGSDQPDGFRAHNHPPALGSFFLSLRNGFSTSFSPTGGQGTAVDGISTGNTGENETRPRNIALLGIIKY